MVDVAACRKGLKGFAGKRVLIVGDLMLDEHVWGTVERISPEAPVMVVKVDPSTQSWQENRPGGAANVAANIRALGAEAVLLGVVGDDEGGDLLMGSLRDAGVDVSGVVVDKGRPTTRKTRIWASHRHQVVRVDRESRKPISQAVAKLLIERIGALSSGVDAVLLSDYDKGILSRDIAQAAIASAARAGKVSVSNPKPRNLSHFGGVGVMTLNQSEAAAASGVDITGEADAEKAGRRILAKPGCRGVVVTRGGHGLSVFDGPESVVHVPAVESEVFDVAGAGDTVVGALTLALACGLGLPNAAAIANCAGGAVVRKVGVVTTSVAEIEDLMTIWARQSGLIDVGARMAGKP